MFYDRKIKYLDYYEDGERVKGGGFIKLEARDNLLRMDVTVSGLYTGSLLTYDIILVSSSQESIVGRITISGGKGQFRQQYRDLSNIGGTQIPYKNLQGIRIPMGISRELSCRWPAMDSSDRKDSHSQTVQKADTRGNSAGSASPQAAGAKQPSKRSSENSFWNVVMESAEKNDAPQNISGEKGSESGSLDNNSLGNNRFQSGVFGNDASETNPSGNNISESNMPKDNSFGINLPENSSSGISLSENSSSGISLSENNSSGISLPENNSSGISRSENNTSGHNMSESANSRKKRRGNSRYMEISAQRSSQQKAEIIDTLPQKRVQREIAAEDKNARKPVQPLEDKWMQLCAIYPHIHPFHDKREYLSIGPGDFVLFPSASYKMINNSFLLHGYYNYNHLILTRVEQKGEPIYYIGVPGNYYEKEKQVAIMFGFESFECEEEPAQIGDFGYYMMRTQL